MPKRKNQALIDSDSSGSVVDSGSDLENVRIRYNLHRGKKTHRHRDDHWQKAFLYYISIAILLDCEFLLSRRSTKANRWIVSRQDPAVRKRFRISVIHEIFQSTGDVFCNTGSSIVGQEEERREPR